jgi:hypothetical protein
MRRDDTPGHGNADEPSTPRCSLTASTRLRQALVAGIALYAAICLRNSGEFRLLDSVDLAIHETGHLVFAPFGEFLGFLGGSLFQVLFPLAFVTYFWRRRDRFAAYVVLGWVAQNLWNVSVYVADARARRLPLVGGGEHDWAYLLGRLGLLGSDLLLAHGLQFAGVLLFAWCMGQAFLHAGDAAPESGLLSLTRPTTRSAPLDPDERSRLSRRA